MQKLRINTDKLPSEEVTIVLGDKSRISKMCRVVKLLCNLTKLFNDLDSETLPSVSLSDVFYIHESGYEAILGFPFLKEVERQTITVSKLNMQKETLDAPEEVGEDIRDLQTLFQFIAEPHVPQYEVHSDFPLKVQHLELLEKFDHLFTTPFASQSLKVPPFKIELKEGFILRRAYPRRVSPEVQKQVDEELTKLLELGIIQKSSSSICSPIVIAKKPDGSIRLCVDYRILNEATIRMVYPLPHISMLLKRLQGQKYFSSIDLTMGYHQWEVDPKSIPLTAFITLNGLYEYTRVPFGCCNAPNGFQQVMKEILHGLEGLICEVYIDDILIYSKTAEDHLLNTEKVLQRLQDFQVLVKPSKCKWGLPELQFLGHIINDKEIKLSPKRVQKVLDIKRPASAKDVRTFIGLIIAFKSYIPSFAMKQRQFQNAVPKTKNGKFEWSDELEKSFVQIKEDIAKLPSNFHLNYELPILLEVDASDDGIGGVLFQLNGESREPILFLSHAFSPVASRWSTIEQEAYAIFYCITQCEEYLTGHHFTLMTDHKNLLYIYEASSPKIIRWRLRLQMFDFDIVHIPGVNNSTADTLSRLLVMNFENETSQNVITEHQKLDIFKMFHNAGTGHLGINKTCNSIKEAKMSWHNLYVDIERFIAGCPICQKVRLGQGSVLAALATTSKSSVGETVAVDTIGPLPPDVYGNQFIIVMIDAFSRYVEIEAAPDTTALSAAKVILKHIGRYGVPKELQSDNGTQFSNFIIDDLLKLLKVGRRFTLPYRPEANGIVERVNGETMKHLRGIVLEWTVKNTWSLYLPLVQRIINNSFHSAIGTTPSRVVFGDSIFLDRGFSRVLEIPTTEISTYEDYVQDLNRELRQISSLSVKYQNKVIDKRMKKSPAEPTTFDVGDLVLVSYPEKPTDKLTPLWRGPLVVQRVEHQTYYCQDLVTMQVSPFFVTRLKLYQDNETIAPMELAAADRNELIVNSIVGHMGDPKSRKSMKFKVHWQNLESSDDTWEPWENVKHLQVLDEYIAAHDSELKLLTHRYNFKNRKPKRQIDV